MAETVCPRCGARESFMKGYLPETCVCRICQSQLDWREIPGCGPDCKAVVPEPPPPPEAAPTYVAATAALAAAAAAAGSAGDEDTGHDAANPAEEDPSTRRPGDGEQ